MTIEVPEHQVDGLTRVLSRTALRTPLLQRRLQILDGLLDVAELDCLLRCVEAGALVRGLELDESCAMATACVVKSDPEGYRNPNVVKVTKDKRGRALYFSRSPIPCDRNGTAQNYLKHLGIYAYRRGFLLQFPALAPSALERREKLEQLRALENGYQIKVIETIHDSVGVDTEEDFELVNSVILRS